MSRFRHPMILLTLISANVSAEIVTVEDFRINFGTRRHNQCGFAGSRIDLCNSQFIESYKQAVRTQKANFNNNMIVVTIDSRPKYAQQTLVAIDATTKTVYPLPFDFFSSSFSKDDPNRNGKVTYSLQDNSLCVDGGVMAYKSVQDGHLCWRFSEGQFTGEITPYTYPDR